MRTMTLMPSRSELIPWTDKRGRFHRLRAVVFALLLLPLCWLAFQASAGMLGAEPVNKAIHTTGYWTIWLLIASLCITPAKALSGKPNLVVVRRMVGNAALAYALLHLTLYAVDQNWRLPTIVSEIFRRFYLTIGFAALVGMIALGVTSTDGWALKLGRSWKHLHRLAYLIALLGLIHYTLQSKLDVSQAMIAAGVFGWLMMWRLLPTGLDRRWEPLLGISLAAGLFTLAVEYTWYRFGTHANPIRVILSEFNTDFGLHPAGQVLFLGLLATGVVQINHLRQTAFGKTVLFIAIVYSLGGLADDATALFMGWSMADVTPDSASRLILDLAWIAFYAALGLSRYRLRHDRQRHLIDAVWVASVLYHVVLVGTDNRGLGSTCAAMIVIAAMVLGQRIWRISHGAALLLIPLGLLLAYEAVALF